MPTYEYKCSCGEKFEKFSPIKDRMKPCKKACAKCGKKEIEMHYGTAPAICDPVRMGVVKAGNGFKEVMSRIKEKNPRSNIDFNKYM